MGKKEAEFFIKKYQLESHPEGGYFRRIYCSKDQVNVSERYNNKQRFASSHIYYLLQEHDFSAFHRLKSDEHWHFYSGSPLLLYIIDRSDQLQTIVLGHPLTTHNAVPHYCIEQGLWFAAELLSKDDYALIGCTVAPAFEYEDWELANRIELSNQYPQFHDIIMRLT